MALFRKLFYKKPPDGLLEICERVYVFDCCFTIDAREEQNYDVYIKSIVRHLQDHCPDASFLVFNFREGETQSQMTELLSEYDMTIMDYPRQYEGCPLIAMELLHHFLRSCESWLSLGQHNMLLMHCERGGWPFLAFMLAALLIYRKQYSGEQKTLDMIYRQAPRELLQLLSPLNPMPSQLRYLQYVSRRNVASEWPPLDRALTLDCVILRYLPHMDGEGGCRPIFRIYGQDPFLVADRTPKVLYSTSKRSKSVRYYKQKECALVKIDINCHIQGDVMVECINLNDDMEREGIIFRVVFNTAFIRSNILMLNRDEIDILWDAKELFPKEFRAEILFSEMDAASSIISMDFSCFEEKEGLPMEAFAKVQEIFCNVDWLDPRADVAFNMLQQIGASNIVQEKSDIDWNSNLDPSPQPGSLSPKKLLEERKHTELPSSPRSPTSIGMKILSAPSQKSYLDLDASNEAKPQDSHIESFNQSDVTHQQNNQSTANLHDSISPASQISHLTAATAAPVNDSRAVSHTLKVAETKSIAISPQTPLSTPVQPPSTSSATTALPHPPAPPPLPTPLSSSSEPEKSSTATETGTYLQNKDQTELSNDPSSKASSSTSSPAFAIASTLTPPLTPPCKEDPTVRVIPPAASSPSQVSPFKENQTISGVPLEASPSLEKNLVLRATTPAAPVPPPAPPLNKIQAVRDGPIAVAPPPPAPVRAGSPLVPPPPLMPPLKKNSPSRSAPLPPPPPPLHSRQAASPTASSSAPPPSPPPAPALASNSSQVPAAPPPPAPFGKKTNAVPPAPRAVGNSGSSAPAPPPFISSTNSKNRLPSRINCSKSHQTKKLKPLHWLKLSRAVQGSLWAEAQNLGEASKAPEIDMLELENLFSAAAPNTDRGGKSNLRTARGPKSDKVQLIDLRRAYNCEIMLSKVKVPLSDLMRSVLALDESALDVDQVDNLIKFCPTKEEMEVLKGYTGEQEKLGKCEQFFLELMKVPRVESKLRVFSFKIQFRSQVSDLRRSLSVVNSTAEEIRNSVKLKRIMQTILSLGNALNQGTARGSAIGFRLDSLLKLTDTRARNNKMTLMHYLCKVLADKLPDLLDFSKDVYSLESASKIQLKFLAEEMQAISKGLEKVVQELSSSENDGPVSDNFRETLKEFLCFAEAEVRSLASLYSGVGRHVDALILYFGEDPARCLFEQVISTLLNFVRMFNNAHEENCKQLEQEMKKSSENEKLKMNASQKESENLLQTSIQCSNVK
ncbi:formin-like protein 13 [Durio zibethinus]|uniref:Formin-like protein n=1 Tax=Durio zibethinus TaxID=66656 RepID=A0A6P5ZVB9_DURZI|nr:formin-like protein 13 [Durio zibethinus]